jgi:hypothetical protein
MGNNRSVVTVSEEKLISYLRVSPSTKEKARLGIAAQRKAVSHFVEAAGFQIVGEHMEACKSSTGLKHRPVLIAALAEAEARQCSIVVAKLDRLSRDAAFVTYLIAGGVSVLVTELGGDAKPFTLQPYPAPSESRASKTAEDAPSISARMLAMRAHGMTLRAIAESLNAEGLRAPAGGLWQAGHVHRILSKPAGRSAKAS